MEHNLGDFGGYHPERMSVQSIRCIQSLTQAVISSSEGPLFRMNLSPASAGGSSCDHTT